MSGHLEQPTDGTDTQAIVPSFGGVEAAVRAAVSARLGEARFSLWFGEGVRLRVSGEGDALEVHVPTPYFREWIESHYKASLIEAAEAVMGRRLRLLIQVYAETDFRFGDAVNPATTRDAPKRDPGNSGDVAAPMLGDHKALFSSPSPMLSDAETSLLPGLASLPHFLPPEPPKRLQTISPRPALSPGKPLSRPVRRLESFVTGASNRLAHAASCEMARSAGTAFNPLVIHGSIGLGKTHLLEGIAHGLKLAHPTLQIIQLTAEAFTNGFLESIRTSCLNNFRARYRGAGGLIVDDIHFLAAKRATMIEFLHTFNSLIEKGAPDRPVVRSTPSAHLPDDR